MRHVCKFVDCDVQKCANARDELGLLAIRTVLLYVIAVDYAGRASCVPTER